jgi:hypothetical protein
VHELAEVLEAEKKRADDAETTLQEIRNEFEPVRQDFGCWVGSLNRLALLGRTFNE